MESKHIKKEIFLGFNAYTESDADIFKGRDADIEHLYDLVSNKDYVLCYAESGEGKSSLLDAGLTPRLRTNRYFPVKIAFTDEEYNNNNIVFDEVIKSRIMEAVSGQQNLSFVPKSDSIFNEKYSNDLWWFLRNNTLSLYGISFTIVLIFDQFEEVINYPKSDAWTSRFFAFLEKISTDDCPQYILDDINATVDSHDDLDFPNIPLKKNFKAIFSIRTEYIGELDYWCMQRYFIPDLKHNRFCLKPLTLQGADEVMRQYEGFDAELRDSIKDVLLRLKNKDNRTADDNNVYEQYIPALILSIVCTSLYQNSNKVLTNSLIADSIENFYNDKIKECNISLEERNTIASVLVDKDKRVRVASDCSALEKIKFNKKYKDALLRNRLIKKSNVNGVEYIELVHDSLIDVVKKHKEEAIQKELRKKRRRNMAIFSIMTSIILLFVILIIGLKKNEKNFLITQAKFIAAEAEKLAEGGDLIDVFRLMRYVSQNNKAAEDVYEIESLIRKIDAFEKQPYKFFDSEFVSFTSGGKYLLVSTEECYKLWSLEDKTYKYKIDREYGASLAISPNDKYLIFCSYGTAELYSLESGSRINTISTNIDISDQSLNAFFSPDSKYICIYNDNGIEIWSIEDEGLIHTICIGTNEYIKYIDFYLDGIIVCTTENLMFWSIENKELVKRINFNQKHFVYGCIGGNLVYSSMDSLFVWSIDDEKNIDTIGELSYYSDVDICKKYIVIGDFLNRIIWSLERREIVDTLDCQRIVFDNDGVYAATILDNTINIWSVDNKIIINSIPFKKGVPEVEFSPCGNYILVNFRGDDVRLYETKKNVINDCCLLSNNDENDLYDFQQISIDGKLGLNGNKLWSLYTGKDVFVLPDRIYHSKFTPDCKNIIAFGDGMPVTLWSVKDKKCIDTIDFSYEYTSDGKYLIYRANEKYIMKSLITGNIDTLCHEDMYVRYSSAGGYIIVGEQNGTVKLYSAKKSLHADTVFDINDDIRDIRFCSNENYFITISKDRIIRLWSMETKSCIQTFYVEPEVRILKTELSHDEKYVVVTYSHLNYHMTGGGVVLWSVKTGECIHNSHNERDAIRSIEYSPDGNTMAIVWYHSGCEIWDLEGENCIEKYSKPNKVRRTMFSSDGKYLLLLSEGKYIYDPLSINSNIIEIVMLENNECLFKIDCKNDIEKIVFTPDNNYLIALLENRKIGKISISPLSEILDKWSEMLGPNAELTEEEKEKYFLN